MARTTTILTTSRKPIAIILATVAVAIPGLASGAGDTSPHWNDVGCQTCHVHASPTADNLSLQAEYGEQLCEQCHSSRGDATSCRHLSGISAGDHPMPDSYRANLRDDNLACTTCHDLAVQCLSPHPSYSLTNPGFIRDRSSRNRAEHCFECHDRAGYEQLNPHVMEAGDPAQPTCTFCHATMPLKDERGWISVDFNVPGSLNDMCRGCHNVQPHPGSMFSVGSVGWNHLDVPSPEILKNMKETEARLGFVFPLDPDTGEMYCATCHNPHHEDLDHYPVAEIPGTKYRLRVADNCQACHDL